jgi:hypothetical protein
MKIITARYFVTCLTSPDTFELNNESFTTHETIEWIQMNVPSPESLGSGKDYTFSKMQNNIWACLKKTHFIGDRDFMKILFSEIKDADPEAKSVFFKTLFDKMHLELSSIKAEKFAQAEANLGILKALLDFDEGAAEVFVNSPDFYSSGMNGLQLQR